MKKEAVIAYLTIFAKSAIISPLVFVFFALDNSMFAAAIMTVCVYVGVMLMVIPMFNYLEYGKFSYRIKGNVKPKSD